MYNTTSNNDRTYHIHELTNNDPLISYNFDCNITLKEHQRALIKNCIELENVGIKLNTEHLVDKYRSVQSNIGIIADKVGSGKSFSLLGLILANKKPLVNLNKQLTYGCNNISVELNSKSHVRYLDLNIIVIPHNIKNQWHDYVLKFSNSFKSYLVHTHKTFENLEQKLDDINILIVTSSFYKLIVEDFIEKDIHINRLIFDEVDSANTPNSKSIPACFYWFVSASYANIINPYPRWHYDRRNYNNSYMISSGINNNTFVKNIFANIMRTSVSEPSTTSAYIEHCVVDGIVMKNDDKYVEQSFNLPDVIKHNIICKNSIEISVLKDVINEQILNCLNAGDIKGAVSNINPNNIDTEENIIDHVKKDLEIKLNNINVNLEYMNNIIHPSVTIKEQKIAKVTKEKLDIENKIKLIRERITSNENCCTICYNEPENKCIIDCCKNAFCLKCITTWSLRSNSCPLCKSKYDIKNGVYVVDDLNTLKIKNNLHVINENDSKHYNKFENLNKLLKNRKTNSKILIFSEFDNSFSRIKDILDEHDISYAQLKGNHVNNIVQKYKHNDDNRIDVLLINSRSYGSGLNLENTTDIVLFHRFNSEIEKQVIGRAQRPGRTEALNVWYLLHDNEI